MEVAAAFAQALHTLASGAAAPDRATAARTLARMAARHTATADDAHTLPLFVTAGGALARSLSSETSATVREAVRVALSEMLAFVAARRVARQPLLLGLIRELADANRALLARFTESLACYAVARRHQTDASVADPLQRIARVTAFCEREPATHQALRALAGTPACRQAIQTQAAREQVRGNAGAGSVGSPDGAALLEALIDTAALLREGRDLLAVALRQLTPPPDAALVSPAALTAYRREYPLALANTFLAGACLRAAALAGADLSSAFLIGADLEAADLRGADMGGALLTMAHLSGCQLPTASAPVEVPPPPRVENAPVGFVVGKGDTVTPGRRMSMRGGIAAAARRATAPLTRPTSGDVRDPFGSTGSKKSRLETINAVNAVARPDAPDQAPGPVQIRPNARPEDERALASVDMRVITEQVREDVLPSIVLSSGTLKIRDTSDPKATRLTDADLKEVTDLLKDR
jgi:hypothetical protein